MAIIKTIEIDGMEFPRPSALSIKREDVYKGEYETCTGAVKADRVGWKYSDASLQFDALSSSQLAKLNGLSTSFTLSFDDSGTEVEETVIRTGFEKTPTRFTRHDGTAIWKDCILGVRFINVHND